MAAKRRYSVEAGGHGDPVLTILEVDEKKTLAQTLRQARKDIMSVLSDIGHELEAAQIAGGLEAPDGVSWVAIEQGKYHLYNGKRYARTSGALCGTYCDDFDALEHEVVPSLSAKHYCLHCMRILKGMKGAVK